jgi:hypothetical protein
MASIDRTERELPSLAAARSQPVEAPPVCPLHLPEHVVEPGRLDPLDRALQHDDIGWLRPGHDGPPPRLPRDLPGTTFEDPPPERGGDPAFEPLPFHPKWVVAAILCWATVWLTLFVASGWLLRF